MDNVADAEKEYADICAHRENMHIVGNNSHRVEKARNNTMKNWERQENISYNKCV